MKESVDFTPEHSVFTLNKVGGASAWFVRRFLQVIEDLVAAPTSVATAVENANGSAMIEVVERPFHATGIEKEKQVGVGTVSYLQVEARVQSTTQQHVLYTLLGTA